MDLNQNIYGIEQTPAGWWVLVLTPSQTENIHSLTHWRETERLGPFDTEQDAATKRKELEGAR